MLGSMVSKLFRDVTPPFSVEQNVMDDEFVFFIIPFSP